jgi:UDPglucose--hexose-1-phosphate uridylyltransferase
MSEIRENKITGEWVIIAPERARRGGNLVPAVKRMEPSPFLASCPFCLGNEAATAEERFRVEGEDGCWLLRSVVNKFSVLSQTGEVTSASCPSAGEASVNAVGLHEVIIESPRHDVSLAVLPVAHMQRILEAYRQRFGSFYADSRVRHVIVFKNHGADAGASQQHPHSQIVGLPIVPGQVVERIERARRFFDESGQCLACSQIAMEREQACRIIVENAGFVAFIPYAALSPYHLWIFPKAHLACFSEQPMETLPALAEILTRVLGKVHGMLGNPAFNFVIRSLGPRESDAPHFHWYISIVPRINKRAGLELGTGMYVNPSLPESCAQALREFSPF